MEVKLTSGKVLNLLRYRSFECPDGIYTCFISKTEKDENGDNIMYIFRCEPNGMYSCPDPEVLAPLLPFIRDFMQGRDHFMTANEKDLGFRDLGFELPKV